MKTKKFNPTEIKVIGLDGLESPMELGKPIGNFIYSSVSDLGWLDPARIIYENKTVELTEDQLRFLLDLVSSERCQFILAVKYAITQYINNLLNSK